MARTQAEQERTHDAFLAEVSKAPNAVEILRLYNRIMQDDDETIRRIIANKDELIAGLKERIYMLCGRTGAGGSSHRRWN